MKIRWLGHSTFVITSQLSLVLDPHDKSFGQMPTDLKASIVIVSHQHHDHNNTQAVGGNPIVIDKPGNYIENEFRIKGVPLYHDHRLGQDRGTDIGFVITAENIAICHLGDLGHKLDTEQLEQLGKIDILMIPVGGYYTIDSNEAIEVVNQVKPHIVMPMHYKPTPEALPTVPIDTVDNFINNLGWNVEKLDELEITQPILNSITNQVILFNTDNYD